MCLYIICIVPIWYRIGHHNIHSTIYNINKRKDDEAVGNDQ